MFANTQISFAISCFTILEQMASDHRLWVKNYNVLLCWPSYNFQEQQVIFVYIQNKNTTVTYIALAILLILTFSFKLHGKYNLGPKSYGQTQQKTVRTTLKKERIQTTIFSYQNNARSGIAVVLHSSMYSCGNNNNIRHLFAAPLYKEPPGITHGFGSKRYHVKEGATRIVY